MRLNELTLKARLALGFGVVLALMSVHAWVLALECVLMAWHNRRDPAPRAGWRAVLGAWWAESHIAVWVFAWLQPFAWRRWPDTAIPRASNSGQRAVVLVHGFGGDLNNWLFNHPALAAERRVIALDLPGHGESAKALQRGDLDELSETVLALLDHLDIAKAHLAGHSMGGAVSLNVARLAPQRVASLSLVASAGLGEAINGQYLQGFVTAANRNALKPQMVQLFADPALVTRQMLEDMLKFKRLEGVDQALQQLAGALADGDRQRHDLRGVLGNHPALVVWGGKDAIIPASHAEGLEAEVLVLPEAGHMVQMEAAEQVNQQLLAFLRKH